MRFLCFKSRQFSAINAVVLVNSKIKAFIQQGNHPQALLAYSKEPLFPLHTSKFTFPPLLKACAFLPNLQTGKIIHGTIIQMGLHYDPFIITSLINMYVKCGSLCNAVQVFDFISQCEDFYRDVTIWNAMLDGYIRNELTEECMGLFRRMQEIGVKSDEYSLSILLGLFNGRMGLSKAKEVHGYVIRNSFGHDPFVVTALIDMYSNCGRPKNAWCVFESVQDKDNIVMWNALIRGLSENGLWRNSMRLYSLAKNWGCKLMSTTFSCTLKACAEGEDIDFGRQIHSDVVKMDFENDPYVCTSALSMYARFGLLEDADRAFNSVLNKEVEVWNSIISAYVGKGRGDDALCVYNEMRSRGILSDSFTLSNILVSCSMTESYDLGSAIHGEMIKKPIQNNIALQSALVTMYSKCGMLKDALDVFSRMEEKDVVAWGSMISGLCQNKKFNLALEIYKEMETHKVNPDANIMAMVINASAGLESLELGCSIHAITVKSGEEVDSSVSCSLVDMYSNCGKPEMAEKVFSGVPYKNLVAWNSLISCYSKNDLPELSLNLLPQLVQQGLYPDAVTITSAFAAVSSLATLIKGKAIHCYQIRHQILEDNQVENALIDMYIKSGCLKYAERIFQYMSKRNLVTWNTMIAGYGSHSECMKAINFFNEMRKSRVTPDAVTFLSLISSCNHAGLMDEGLKLFHLMALEYGIKPQTDHYINVVDLLGRAGQLEDAYNFIQNLEVEPERGVWLCLLSACRVHQNVKLGEIAAKNLLKMEPNRGSNYVQLLNLYVDGGMREEAASLRTLMRQKGLKKNPGCSWIEVKNELEVFYSSDSSSTKTIEIYETLQSLRSIMKKRGDYETEAI
ncbi:pentatricopeptide repeat-containing protein At2g40720 [Solanum stenotomum]|uniref:pentatricopeptide repeat-containing protein At2g40720 n=1 Tax=Solanum stenotomum TaxID=172797 RepID=UPI0020D02D54|nr:pentatricopeptide repeat-containing protein At2g40720 [Solanum stenotomum]